MEDSFSEEFDSYVDFVLRPQEKKVISDAESLIRETIVPDNQLVAEQSLIYSRALEYTSRLQSLRSGILLHLSRKKAKMWELQSEEIETLKDEGYRSSDERYRLSNRNPYVKQLSCEISELEVLESYLDMTCWNLRSLAKKLGG